MNLRSIVLPAAALAAALGCSRAGLRAGDGAVGGNADSASGISGSGGITPSTGGALSSGGAGGSGGMGSDGGMAGSGGGGGGGAAGCLGRSLLGLGVGGGACEGVRCLVANPPALGYETCSWLVTAGRPSVFEAVRACFDADPAFCSHEADAVETCTSSVFARACPGPGATVAGAHVDCAAVAADCPAVSETECQRLTNVLNDSYYQAAFACYFQAGPRPANCAAALRACVGIPTRATGGGGAGGTTDTGGVPGTGGTSAGDDGGTQAACPDVAGTWTVAVDCMGPGAFFNGAIAAVMTQTGCRITFTQTDDATGAPWVASGTLEADGRGSLRGSFAFTDSSMCDVEVTADGWQGRCGSATQACELHAVTPKGGP